jgi:hypothetical protein
MLAFKTLNELNSFPSSALRVGGFGYDDRLRIRWAQIDLICSPSFVALRVAAASSRCLRI